MSAYREHSSGQTFPSIHSLPLGHILRDFQEASQDHSVLGGGFVTFGGSETHSDNAGTGPWWIERLILSTSLRRKSWLSALLLKNIDSSFWRLMEKFDWFLFLLLREAAGEITALGGNLG